MSFDNDYPEKSNSLFNPKRRSDRPTLPPSPRGIVKNPQASGFIQNSNFNSILAQRSNKSQSIQQDDNLFDSDWKEVPEDEVEPPYFSNLRAERRYQEDPNFRVHSEDRRRDPYYHYRNDNPREERSVSYPEENRNQNSRDLPAPRKRSDASDKGHREGSRRVEAHRSDHKQGFPKTEAHRTQRNFEERSKFEDRSEPKNPEEDRSSFRDDRQRSHFPRDFDPQPRQRSDSKNQKNLDRKDQLEADRTTERKSSLFRDPSKAAQIIGTTNQQPKNVQENPDTSKVAQFHSQNNQQAQQRSEPQYQQQNPQHKIEPKLESKLEPKPEPKPSLFRDQSKVARPELKPEPKPEPKPSLFRDPSKVAQIIGTTNQQPKKVQENPEPLRFHTLPPPSQSPAPSPSSSGNHQRRANEPLPALDSISQINPKDFNPNPKSAKFFVIKSNNEEDVHKAMKYSLWASTKNGNQKLDAAYQSSHSTGPIYLFFSVNASGQFCGVAEMTSPLDSTKNFGRWKEGEVKYPGRFSLKWIFIKDVPSSILGHITLSNNDGLPVTRSRDTQEILHLPGCEFLRIFHKYPQRKSLLDNFSYFETHEEEYWKENKLL